MGELLGDVGVDFENDGRFMIKFALFSSGCQHLQCLAMLEWWMYLLQSGAAQRMQASLLGTLLSDAEGSECLGVKLLISSFSKSSVIGLTLMASFTGLVLALTRGFAGVVLAFARAFSSASPSVIPLLTAMFGCLERMCLLIREALMSRSHPGHWYSLSLVLAGPFLLMEESSSVLGVDCAGVDCAGPDCATPTSNFWETFGGVMLVDSTSISDDFSVVNLGFNITVGLGATAFGLNVG